MSENTEYPLAVTSSTQDGVSQPKGNYDYRIFAPGFGSQSSPANDYPLVFRESVESIIAQGKKYAESMKGSVTMRANGKENDDTKVIKGTKPSMRFSKDEVAPDTEQHGAIAAAVKNYLDGEPKTPVGLQFRSGKEDTEIADSDPDGMSESKGKPEDGSINASFSARVYRSNSLLSLCDSVVIPPHLLQKINGKIPSRLSGLIIQTSDNIIYCRLPYVPQQVIASLNLDLATNLAQRHSAAMERLIALLKQLARSYLFKVKGIVPFYVDKDNLKKFLRDKANANSFVVGKSSSGIYYVKLADGKSFSQLTIGSQKLLIEKVSQYFKVVITCQ